jgi:hypothetical protein
MWGVISNNKTWKRAPKAEQISREKRTVRLWNIQPGLCFSGIKKMRQQWRLKWQPIQGGEVTEKSHAAKQIRVRTYPWWRGDRWSRQTPGEDRSQGGSSGRQTASKDSPADNYSEQPASSSDWPVRRATCSRFKKGECLPNLWLICMQM